jgi:hypothetical protein
LVIKESRYWPLMPASCLFGRTARANAPAIAIFEEQECTYRRKGQQRTQIRRQGLMIGLLCLASVEVLPAGQPTSYHTDIRPLMTGFRRRTGVNRRQLDG